MGSREEDADRHEALSPVWRSALDMKRFTATDVTGVVTGTPGTALTLVVEQVSLLPGFGGSISGDPNPGPQIFMMNLGMLASIGIFDANGQRFGTAAVAPVFPESGFYNPQDRTGFSATASPVTEQITVTLTTGAMFNSQVQITDSNPFSFSGDPLSGAPVVGTFVPSTDIPSSTFALPSELGGNVEMGIVAGSFTIQAVPEPSSIVAAGMAMVVGLSYYVLTRHKRSLVGVPQN